MKKSLRKSALIISFGTFISKLGGMSRELLIASAFGISSAYDAYNYAYVIPGFFLILIGGINGPLHNSVTAVLSKRDKKEGLKVIHSIYTSVSLLLLVISIFIFIFSAPIISIIAPGLSENVHNIAVIQLQIMSPIILLSGLIGISFGSLNSRNIFFITSISPIISSISIILGVLIFMEIKNSSIDSSMLAINGGIILAKATLIGALLQFIIQIPSLIKRKLFKFKFDLNDSGFREVWKIFAPASLSSSMLQLNVITDLFFASSITGAAAALGYANFLVQAPLGIISSSLLVPMIPIFAKTISSNDNNRLVKLIKNSLIVCLSSMIMLSTIFIVLGTSIVSLIYGRGEFDNQAIKVVSGLLIVYGIGMPFYLCRDLLVRVFYSYGDGLTPFNLATIGIILNVILDWLFVGGNFAWGIQSPINLGTKGLILATVGVNIFTCTALLFKLNYKLGYQIPIKKLSLDFIKLIICGLTSGTIGYLLNLIINFPSNFTLQIIKIIFSSATLFITFFLTAKILKIKEIQELISPNKAINSEV